MINNEFEEIDAESNTWTSNRKLSIGVVLAGIMLVAVVVAGSANKTERTGVLQRQAIQDAHPMYQELEPLAEGDFSLAEDDFPSVWAKVKADATGDGFSELVMCGNTYGAHYFWNEWNGGAATLKNVAQNERLVIRMYDQKGNRVQSNGNMQNGNAWWNVRHDVWINHSGLNGNVNGAKGWVNQNFPGGNAYLKDRMWWSCPTNRHTGLSKGRVYWACGHGTHNKGGLHVDKVAKVCVWHWQNRNRKDTLDQFFLFYKKMTCRL